MGNRQTRQTPILIGDGPDFPLVALAKGKPRITRHLRPPRSYPSWLSAAWKVREQWQREDRPRVAAWLARQLDTVLLQAERNWVGGGDAMKVQTVLRMEIDRLEKTYVPLAAASAPGAAIARPSSRRGDPAVVKSLQELLKQIDDAHRKFPKPTTPRKRSPSLSTISRPRSSRNRTSPSAAGLSSPAAVQDPFLPPRRATLQIFDHLLLERQPEPRYEETLVLHRLAELADAMRR